MTAPLQETNVEREWVRNRIQHVVLEQNDDKSALAPGEEIAVTFRLLSAIEDLLVAHPRAAVERHVLARRNNVVHTAIAGLTTERERRRATQTRELRVRELDLLLDGYDHDPDHCGHCEWEDWFLEERIDADFGPPDDDADADVDGGGGPDS